jgi:hypothetical protein
MLAGKEGCRYISGLSVRILARAMMESARSGS